MIWVLLIGGLIPISCGLAIIYMNRNLSMKRVEEEAEDDYENVLFEEEIEETPPEPLSKRLAVLRKIPFLGRRLPLKLLDKIPIHKIKLSKKGKKRPKKGKTSFENDLNTGLIDRGLRRWYGMAMLLFSIVAVVDAAFIGMYWVHQEYGSILGYTLLFIEGIKPIAVGLTGILLMIVVSTALRTGMHLVKN